MPAAAVPARGPAVDEGFPRRVVRMSLVLTALGVLYACLSLGRKGVLPPPLAAWFPGVLYAGAVALLMVRPVVAGPVVVRIDAGVNAIKDLKGKGIAAQPRGNTELERISDVTSLPVVDKEQVCAVSFQGRVACFSIGQGNLVWSRDLSSDKGLALQGNNIYVTDASGGVSALDKSSGSSLWKSELLLMRQTSAPIALGNHVVVGDYEGYLHALNREDGSMAARIKTDGSGIVAAPVRLDDGLLVQTREGGLYSFAIR